MQQTMLCTVVPSPQAPHHLTVFYQLQAINIPAPSVSWCEIWSRPLSPINFSVFPNLYVSCSALCSFQLCFCDLEWDFFWSLHDVELAFSESCLHWWHQQQYLIQTLSASSPITQRPFPLASFKPTSLSKSQLYLLQGRVFSISAAIKKC